METRLKPLMSRRFRLLMIAGVTFGTVAIIMTLPRIPQDQAYHNFADQRTLLGLSACRASCFSCGNAI